MGITAMKKQTFLKREERKEVIKIPTSVFFDIVTKLLILMAIRRKKLIPVNSLLRLRLDKKLTSIFQIKNYLFSFYIQ
jgi:hypothetical protein